jgi:PAS domain S-box-containing protein
MVKGPKRAEPARRRVIRAVDLEESRPIFDRIARTAQRLTGAPYATISIPAADQVWMAGVWSGGATPKIPYEHSFTRHVIDGERALWVEDPSSDPRFAGNPFLKTHRVRSYAGAPVVLSDGSRVGALSVVYREPRPYDEALACALEDLAALVAQEWERSRAMKALKAGEAKVRAANAILAEVVERAPVALLMTDRKLRILQTSYRWRHDMGVADRDLTGKPTYEVFPGSQTRWGSFLDRALKGETVRARRARLVLPDGRRPWVRSEITAWRDRRGRIGGLLIMTHDISDMVEALEKTRRSEQTLKLALDIGELSMWEMDHRDRQLNNAGQRITTPSGSSRDYDDLARDIWYGVHPADLPAAKAEWERCVKEGVPFRATYRLMQRNGPHIWVRAATEVIRDENGDPERTVGVLRNIDKQKRSEIAIARAKDEAETANRAKSEFLANMSHEIRTPLNGVMGVASALARTPLDANQHELVGLIETSAKTLERLLSDVLDLARVESGRLELASEPFDLRRCITDIGALFQPSAQRKNLTLVVEPTPEIEGVFLGDAARVRQILSNLVANAVKFTSSGEVRIGASGKPTRNGVEARLWVEDTGIGFDEETKARLFGRFEQADGSITRRYGGTGLGLAISRSLAQRMGGVLEAVAAPGKGATFTLVLPLARAKDRRRQRTREVARAPDVSGADQSGLKVLLAEDHPINRRVVELILGSVGVNLTCVENGQLAVEAWKSGDFDLVLMDMQMPVMDGLTAIREIRSLEAAQRRAPVRIFALTANAMPEHIRASGEAGADGHLSKPITADALFRIVETAASGSPAQSQRLAS